MDIIGKKFLVIGGAGLIGSHTVEELLKEDVKEVIIYDNFVRGTQENLEIALKDKRCKIFGAGGDILQNDILEKSLEGIDGVFHFAALWLLQCHEFPKSAFNVNVQGTFNVLEACRKANIKKLVYSSSASVYGDALSEPITETHPFNNKNFYGATKICGESMLAAYHHRYNLNFVGLRYMNVYGPRQDYRGAYIAVIMKMLNNIENNKSPIIYGDGNESFDFIFVEDCAKANICAMKSSSKNGFYNVGTGIKTSLKEIAEILLKLTNSNLKIKYIPREQKTFVKNRIGCPKKASKEINFKYSVKLEDGLIKLLNWRKKHLLESIKN
tara:strand:+ start:7666 stop:8643 length:978 start_codon:yes stop_codon:yes gene_type:complete